MLIRCFGEKNAYSYKLSWLDQKEDKNKWISHSNQEFRKRATNKTKEIVIKE